MKAVPPTDLLRGLYAIIAEDPRTQEDLMHDVGYGTSTLARWWQHNPQSLKMLTDIADHLGYRVMFVSHAHPLSAVARPVIKDPSK